ncbi:MAG TPA: amino acid adenylation domain-containing protein, partial [Bryobacteraceae bacterium]|nr:amino acid adenylation domain-containing protein [Bryobacteraceae bacterium]
MRILNEGVYAKIWADRAADLAEEQAKVAWTDGGVYLITGGMGALARAVASDIASRQRNATIVLAGRSAVTKEFETWRLSLSAEGTQVRYRQADIADSTETKALVDAIWTQYGRLDGVLHAAGKLDDCLLPDLDVERLTAVLAPKVLGAHNLDEAIGNLPLDFFVLFGSVSSVLGSTGQIGYSGANAYLDVFAAYREGLRASGDRHGRTVSISWPLWKQGGMRMSDAASHLMRRTTGLDSLSTEDGLTVLHRAAQEGPFHVLVGCGNIAQIRRRLTQEWTADGSDESAPVQFDRALLNEKVQELLVDCICQLLKLSPGDLEPDIDLSEYGFDSITFTQFSNELNDRLNLSITPTFFFENPTLEALVQGLAATYGAETARALGVAASATVSQPAPSVSSNPQPVQPIRKNAPDSVAVIGMSGAFPLARDLQEFWTNLAEGRDCIREVPADRWDWRAYWGDPAKEPGKTNVKWAGFVDEIAEFDPAFFGISPPEARAMDPQQRLLLTHAWLALENAGYAPKSLAGSNTGVFVGIADTGYGRLVSEAGTEIEGYLMTGLAPSLGPNRISHYLNIHGPSIAIETACSSSLVAVSRAVESIRSGACDLALAGGVNTLLLPDSFIGFSRAGMLSPEGKCKTFSAEANGYVRGEGVGLIVLKRLADAERDGDSILGVIRAVAENHGGRSGALTAPNPKAQANLLRAAYRSAGFDPRTVTYVEAHGTGTSLGDPIEVDGLTAAFAELTREAEEAQGELRDWPCAIGTVKTNIGHLELAAGIAGLIKVLLQLKQETIVPVLHCETLNPYLQLEGTRFYIAREKKPWFRPVDSQGCEVPRRAGVSSFGFGGSNAHVVVEEYIPESRVTLSRGSSLPPKLVVLSARTEDQLVSVAHQLRNWLRGAPVGIDLADVAYSLQIGRDAMEHRLGFCATDISDAIAQLDGFLGNQRLAGLHVNSVKANRDILTALESDEDLRSAVASLPMRGRHASLLQLWVRGLAVDWSLLYESEVPKRVALPGYPFARNRYWVDDANRTVRSDSPLGHQTQKRILTGSEWFVRDHRVGGQVVVPGVVHLEFVREAVAARGGWLLPIELRQHTWIAPIVLGGPPAALTVDVRNRPDDTFVYELKSGESVYSAGIAAQGSGSAPWVDLRALRAEATQNISVDESYRRFDALGLSYGAGKRTIRSLYRGEHLVVAELEVPDTLPMGDFCLHPCLADGALQAIIGFASETPLTAALPYSIRQIEIFAGSSRRGWAIVRKDAKSSDSFHIELCDDGGAVQVRIVGFTVRQVQRRKSTLESLVEIAAKVLEVESYIVETDTELGEFGFDSVTMTAFASKVNEKLGLSLTPADFFEFATLERLARHIGDLPEPLTLKEVVSEAPLSPGAHANTEEPIAIVGMSGQFPMASDVNEFWRNLWDARDCITEVPEDRWDWKALYGDPKTEPGKTTNRWGGFIDNVFDFDPLFFGISPREASWMDPQQRLLLMHTWKAIEDAGHSPREFGGQSVGIFVGTSLSSRGAVGGEGGNAYAATGAVPSIGPNRVSYFFDWHGPSEPIETACSSALVAVHRAIQAIRSGDCEMAIAGGVNTIITPEAHVLFSQAGMLSPDGRCKTFSSGANGYVRGEGIGLFLMKRLSHAERDGDSIYGILRGSAINHGGRANSLTAPNTSAQAELLKKAYQGAEVDPATVTYIEAHGTGTALGDPVEINALKALFTDKVHLGECALGAVKTNIGHLELAAGAAGLAKVLLQLQYETLAPSLHGEIVNPYIDFAGSPLTLIPTRRRWEVLRDEQGQEIPRRAGISSFGFGGVNAHVVIEEHRKSAGSPGRLPVLIMLSAREEDRLRQTALNLASWLESSAIGDSQLEDVSYTLFAGREPMKHRAAAVVASVPELVARLRGFASGEAGKVCVGLSVKQPAAEPSSSEHSLLELAERWVAGHDVEAALLFQGNRRRLHLPTYPFVQNQSPRGVRVGQAGNGDIVLDPRVYYLRDHCVHGRPVLPGAMGLELVRRACMGLNGRSGPDNLSFRHILWREPVVVNGESVTVNVQFESEPERTKFRLVARNNTIHMQGSLQWESETQCRIDTELIRKRCPETFGASEFYALFAMSGIDYGPSFQTVESAFCGSSEVLVRLILPSIDVDSSLMHPSMVDGAFQACGLLWKERDSGTMVPFALERLDVLAATTAEMWAHIREAGSSATIRKLDIDLARRDGVVCIRVRGLSLRILPAPRKKELDPAFDVRSYLKTLVAEESGVAASAVLPEAPLEDYGLDSMMIARLTDRLEERFGPLPKTLFFEYQNIEQLTGYFADKQEASAPTPTTPLDSNSDIAIIGLAGRYPGANNLKEFWDNLSSGRDSVTEVPLSRWDHSKFYDIQRGEGKTNSKWGGFLEDVDCFDPLFFHISPREAEFLDPQERIFLQCAWEAIEDAGYTRASLSPDVFPMRGGDVGVFVGVMYEEYQLWGAGMTALGNPTALSGSSASIANRVSYFCNFHGPSLSVDTMCSSSLTAIHLACESLRAGSCSAALAGGVNLTLHPNKYLCLAQGRFTSTTGKCESYGRGGDGYVPGEGVGAVILKPLARAIADGDHVYGLIRSTALNHGGKTNGYTVPNPHAQSAVIAAALKRGGVNPRAISYVEGHGTGTSLGDPIEIAALSKAYRAHTSDHGFCAIGSVKSNIGHCESAAGIAGLTKVLLQLQHKKLVPSLHSETLNPGIDFASSPFVVQRELADWPTPHGGKRLAGISAFGAGGSNVHLIVEEYVPASAPTAAPLSEVLVFPFSASDPNRLRELLDRYVAALPAFAETDLASIAFVLQHGRESFSSRVAIEASSIRQLRQRLEAAKAGQPGLLGESKLAEQAKRWLRGGEPEWGLFVEPGRPPRRVSLPTYPFARERFWPIKHQPSAEKAEPARLPLLFSPRWRRAELRRMAPKLSHATVVLCNISSPVAVPGADVVAFQEDDFAEQATRILASLQQIVIRQQPSVVQVVIPAQYDGWRSAGLSGMLRTAQWEYPASRFQLIEIASSVEGIGPLLRDEQLSGEAHVRYSEVGRSIRCWEEISPVASKAPWKDGGVYLITGGTGGLGLLLAEAISRDVSGATLWLTSRSAMSAEVGRRTAAMPATVLHRLLNVAEMPAVEKVVQEMLSVHGRIDGIIHCAGIIRDSRLVRKTAAEMKEVLAPKVTGAINLDAAIGDVKLDFFYLFASISGALGNIGQVDYAAANAFLDAFAAERNRQVAAGLRCGRTISLDWPYWRDGGMHLDEAAVARMRDGFGVVPLETAPALAALRAIAGTEEDQVVVVDGDADRLRTNMRASVSSPNTHFHVSAGGTDFRASALASLQRHLAHVLQMPVERLDPQEPLDRYGLDSVSAVEVCEAVGRDLHIVLAPTLLLEYPKITALVDHLVTEHGGALESSRESKVLSEVAPSDVAIIAVAGRYPGAGNLEELWEILRQGRDCITEIPPDRWDVGASFAAEKGKLGFSYCKWGGFIDHADCFDAEFFGVSARDAALMDPQERIFLETVWHLLENAGYTRGHLRDALEGRVGVYVGAMSQQYHSVHGSQDQMALVSMSSYASIANRVSYFFDLRGPSIALDTMCSSGLQAVHLACRALQSGECRMAIAGGVNLSIHPNKYVALSRSGLLGSSPDSRGFADGDGYLPAEGVGAVLLKPLSEALRDGDSVVAVIRGSMANHGGHSAGFMIPSAEAQADLIASNLRASGIDARSIGYVEAAVAGSALADSIEIRALTRAFRTFTSDEGYCAIGSVKSNMGHAEAASGMAQLTKVLLQITHRKLVPNFRSATSNPHIHLAGTPFILQSTLSDWNSVGPRRAAISSFGAGGSNIHLLLEEPPSHSVATQVDSGAPWLFYFSAHNEVQLRAWMASMYRYVEKHSDLSLAKLAYTLRNHRERLAYIRVISAAQRQELLAELAAFGGIHETGAQEPLGEPRGPILLLPNYPFARHRHWLTTAPPADPTPAAGSTELSVLDRILRLLEQELRTPVAAIQPVQTFQQIGLDSMSLIRLLQGISEELGWKIPHSELLSHPSPALLAVHLEKLVGDGGRQQELPRIAVVAPFPCTLSEGQQSLWLHHKLFPESAAYNVPLAYRVENLHRDACARTCEWILRSFPILQTVVAESNDEPRLVLHAGLKTPLCTIPVPQGIDPVQYAVARAALPFDLKREMPIRFEILETDCPILLIVVHHIVIDGVSATNLAYSFWRAYDCFVSDNEPPDTEQSAHFQEFVEWERTYLQSDRGESDRRWWLQQLRREMPPLELSGDGTATPANQHPEYQFCEAQIEESLLSRIQSIAASSGISVATLFLGAFAILLSRYCDNEELVLATPVLGRPGRQFQNTFGYFANMLPLRIHAAGDLSAEVFLKTLHTYVSEALDHSSYPLRRIIEDVRRETSSTPHLETSFSCHNFLEKQHFNRPLSTASAVRYVPQVRQIGDTPFGLEVCVEPDKVRLAATFDATRHTPPFVRQFLKHYTNLVSAIAADLKGPIAKLTLLDTKERAEIVEKWSRAAKFRNKRGLVHDWIENAALASPGAVAIRAGEDVVTYGELREQSNRLANYLKLRGARGGTVIATCLERTPRSLIAVLAIWRTGGVWVPLDTGWPGTRLASIIRDARAAIVLTDGATGSAFDKSKNNAVRVICLDRALRSVARCSSKGTRQRIRASKPAYMIYTSGSTGQPKGVVVSHRALAAHCAATVAAYGVTANDVVLQFSAHCTDPAIEQMLCAFTTGATLVMRLDELWTANEFFRLLQSRRITIADVPPGYFREMLRDWKETSAGAGSHVPRLWILGGDVVSPDVVELWRKSPLAAGRLLNAYGPTEATITTTTYEIDADSPLSEYVPIGRPLGDREVYILDRYGNPVPEGLRGELHIGGSCLAEEYCGDPDLTERRFIPNPFAAGRLYRTGDCASFIRGGSGLIAFHGRLDQQVKIRGFRVEIGEVESALLAFGCREAAVLPRREGDGELTLIAFVAPLEFDELAARQFLVGRIPPHMLPTQYRLLPHLPKTASAKVDKRALSALCVRQEMGEGSSTPPRNAVEERLARLWCESLERDSVGVQDDFFALGGHSLLCVRLLASIQREFGRELSIASLLRATTLAQQAELLTTDTNLDPEDVVVRLN